MALDLRDVTLLGPALPELFVRQRLETALVQHELLRRSEERADPETDRHFVLVQQRLRALAEQGGEARVLRHVIAPLRDYLGYITPVRAEPVRTREGDEPGGYWLRNTDDQPQLRVWVVAVGTPLDAPSDRGQAHRHSPMRVAQRVLLTNGERLGLLTDGLELRLLFADPSGHDSCLAIALGRSGGWRSAQAAPDSFHLVRALCQPRGVASIAALLDEARLAQTAVTDQLRWQARRALEGFLQGLLDAPENRAQFELWGDRGNLGEQLWRNGLVLVYRLLFILKLESATDPARRFAFASTSLWRSAFSPSSALADVVTGVRVHGADTGSFLASSLHALFRLCCEGLTAGDWMVTPLGGTLFGAQATPLLDALHWSEQAVAGLLDALLWTLPKSTLRGTPSGAMGRERIDYATLDVEDLGHIYEALLELEPGISVERMARLRRGKLEIVVPVAAAEPYRIQPTGAAALPDPLNDESTADEPSAAELVSAEPTKVRFIEEIAPHHFYLRVGLGRKASGSYYTPHAIVRFLVQEALEPQVTQRSPATDPHPSALLALKVLDPAMGSGHFLVEACRYLGEALYEACRGCAELAIETERQADGQDNATERALLLQRAHALWRRIEAVPDRDGTLLTAVARNDGERVALTLEQRRAQARCRRLVATHCLYGVDKNPLAVELARVSLWLESYADGLPLTFVEQRLIEGDSVTGPAFEQLLSLPSTGKPLEEFLYRDTLPKLLERLRAARLTVASDPTQPLETTATTPVEIAQALAPLRRLAAAYAGGVLLGRAEDDNAYIDLVMSVARGDDGLAVVQARPELQQMIERGRHSVCYALAFPEVFYREGQSAASAGFDAILGNPPWDAIKFNTKEFLAAFDLRVLEAPTKQQRDRIEQELTRSPAIAAQFERYQAEFEQNKRANDRHYRHQKVTIDGDLAGRQLDLYRVFIERSCQLLHPNGSLGFVVPSSFHTAAGAAGVRRLVAQHHRLLKYVTLVNTRRLFEISPGIEFGLLVVRGAGTEAVTAEARFGLVDVEPLSSDAALALLPYPVEELCASNPYFSFPAIESQTALDALLTCRQSGRTFRELQVSLGLEIRSTPTSVHMSHEAKHFLPFVDRATSNLDRVASRYQRQPGEPILLHEGGTFGRFTDSWGDPPRLSLARARVDGNDRWITLACHYKIALRAIVGSSLEKGIATLLPPGCLVSNSALVEAAPECRSNAHALGLVALLNSTPFNWLLSFYADLNVNLFALKYLPVPSNWPLEFAAHGALRLCANHAGFSPLWQEQLGQRWRESSPPQSWPALSDEGPRWRLRAAMDAVLARAYGLERSQYAHVLGCFQHTSFPEFPVYCLEAHDELSTLGLEHFTREYDPYWDVPRVTALPRARPLDT